MCRPFGQTWLLENPFDVDHCGDDYFRLLHGINYAIAVGQQLTNVLIVELPDFAPAMREAREYLGLIDSLAQYTPLSLRRPATRAATILLGEPFAQASFYFRLRQSAISASVFEAVSHLFEHVQVVLNVLN